MHGDFTVIVVRRFLMACQVSHKWLEFNRMLAANARLPRVWRLRDREGRGGSQRLMPRIAIYRHQLFKISEPFITDQAGRLEGCDVVYLGRERFGPAPPGSESHALCDLPAQRSRRARLWQIATRDPRPYLRLVDGHAPDLLHAHFGVEGVYAMPIAARLQIPLVTTFHGFDATLTRRALLRSTHPSWWNYVLHRRELAGRGDLFICVSEYIRKRLIALRFPEARTVVHYIGVDLDSIRPAQTRSATPTIVHIARLVEKKGTRHLIAAFAQLRRKCPDAQLQIVGDGPLEGALRDQAQCLGVAGAVRFLGARPHAQALELLSRAWLLSLPSVTDRAGELEGLGMVLLEAAACAVPVVATWHNGIPEVVVDGVTGYLCAERDEDALAERLLELLRDESLRDRMGRAARHRAEQHFDLARQSAALAGRYAGLLRASHPGPV